MFEVGGIECGTHLTFGQAVAAFACAQGMRLRALPDDIAALGVKLHLRMLPENEHMIFARQATDPTKVKKAASKTKSVKAKPMVVKK